MITFVIQAFESMRAQFTLFSFKIREIGLEICFVILGKMPVMFDFVRFIVFNTL